MEFNSRIDVKRKNGFYMINRSILPSARQALSQFRALCLSGPRQSGKTTLSKVLFQNKPYVNFENPTVQFEAEQNPEVFLKQYEGGAIFDEVQRVPHIFRFLQEILDNNPSRGQFILTGSNNFLVQEQVSQTLAGRAGYLALLPLSYAELVEAELIQKSLASIILTGGYPEIWKEQLVPSIWMNSYVQTYVQRDVRMLRNITNLSSFTRFIYVCANYAGQLFNRDDLARKTGVDTKTIQAWLGLLENSYLVFMLPPWHNNPTKRLVKSSKLYFYDTGLLCFLLGIRTEEDLKNSPQFGAVFENWVVSEVRKNAYNQGISEPMYFYRDSAGNEIDLVLQRNGNPLAIEVKFAERVDNYLLRGLRFWQNLYPNSQSLLIHSGSDHQILNEKMSILPYSEVAHL